MNIDSDLLRYMEIKLGRPVSADEYELFLKKVAVRLIEGLDEMLINGSGQEETPCSESATPSNES